MKKFTALVLFVFGLSFGFGQNPYCTYPGITITKLVDLPTSSFPVRIQRDPVSGDIFYSNFFGQVSRLIPNGTGYIDSTVYTTTDHGITPMQVFFFVDRNLCLVGNYKQFNQPGYGLVKRLKLDANGSRQVSTVMQTVPYPSSATLYEHAFSSIVKMPGKDSLLIASGARTDHGEVNDVNGLFPFTREVALTTSIFKIPYHGNNFTLPNDTAAIDALDAFYCKGVRNTFDMAYNQNGHLFGVENSDERDNPEEINWLRQGHHYGFPWMMGPNYNPQQYPGYHPNNDNMLNRRTSAFQLGKFYND